MLIGSDFIFVHMPRTAGIFVHNFFFRVASGGLYVFNMENDKLRLSLASEVKEYRGNVTLAELPTEYMDKFKFGFIRHPLDWYVSWWTYKYQDEKFDDFINRSVFDVHVDNDCLEIGWLTYRFYEMYYDMENGLKPLVDKIYRYEDGVRKVLDSIFAFNKEQRKELYAMKKINVSTHKPYMEYYTDHLIETVRQRDKLIFDLFGYEI